MSLALVTDRSMPEPLHLKQAAGVYRPSDGDTMASLLSVITVSDLGSFSASPFVATPIIADACCPLGLGHPSYLIMHTSMQFTVPKGFTADLTTSVPFRANQPRVKNVPLEPLEPFSRYLLVVRCLDRPYGPSSASNECLT